MIPSLQADCESNELGLRDRDVSAEAMAVIKVVWFLEGNGITAVVAMLSGTTLYVANAGDSR